MPGVHASQTPRLPSSQKKGEPDWRTWAGQAKPAWSCPVPLPCPVGVENDCGADGPLFQCSPLLRGQGARSRMTTAGLPLLAPCTCLGLKRGADGRSAAPSSPGWKEARGRWWWTQSGLAPLTSVPVALPFLWLSGTRGHLLCQESEARSRKLPSFSPTWPSFCSGGQEGPFPQVHPSAWARGVSGGAGEWA